MPDKFNIILDEDKMRFSDEKLSQLHADFKEHVTRCEDHFNDTDSRFNKLIKAQENNTIAISELIKETRDVVQLHKDLQGVTRIGKSVQSFGLWLVKWPLIGAGLYTTFTWIIRHLPS